MPDIVVRPTLKFIYAAYFVEILLICVAFVVQRQVIQEGPGWVPLILLVLVLWTIVRHIRRLSVKMTVSADKLRYEVGLLSKSTRTIQLGKVQDVRVDQSLAQRILGVGSLAIETAGESSRLVVHDIDQPQAIADEIMRRSELATGTLHQL
jgi:uncharacterized membrane protein YdbT with pleckstrin-like domain